MALASTAFAKTELRSEKKAIRKVIKQAYVKGVHTDQNPDMMRAGFNPSFIMFVNKADGVSHVKLEDWASRLTPRPADKPAPDVKSRIKVLDIEGNTAVARIKLWRSGKLTFTDYMSLYKRDGKWSIVGKVFHRH